LPKAKRLGIIKIVVNKKTDQMVQKGDAMRTKPDFNEIESTARWFVLRTATVYGSEVEETLRALLSPAAFNANREPWEDESPVRILVNAIKETL
jgi:hypothetical protein